MTRRTTSIGAIIGTISLLVLAGSTPALAATEDNLLVNGGFDAPGYDSNGGRFWSGDDMGGWSVGPQNENGFGSKTVQVWYPEMPGEGAVTAAPFPTGPWIRLIGSISQSFPTEVGKTYQLEYEVRATGLDAEPDALGWTGGITGFAYVDGVEADSFVTVAEGPPYATRTVVFTATGTSTLLAFSNQPPIGGGVGLDNVSVTEVPVDDSPILLPAIGGGAALAAAAAGVGWVVRRGRAAHS
jgi:hypothetical protein